MQYFYESQAKPSQAKPSQALNTLNPTLSILSPRRMAGSGVSISIDGLCSRPRNRCGVTSGTGFTLIELSIVLVIIGLLVGGVLVGRDLIRASEIRSQIRQIEEFKTAVNTFKVKYGYLPGDMPPSQASQLGFFNFTGASAGTTCVFHAYGNNDGYISNFNLSNKLWSVGESFAFWSHLSSAKMIKGEYGNVTGNSLIASTATCASGDPGIPTNGMTTNDIASQFLPRSNILPSRASVYVTGNYFIYPSIGWHYYNGTNRNNIFAIRSTIIGTFGAFSGAREVISANQVYQMDSKIDDGFPTSGDVRAAFSTNRITGVITGYSPCTTTVSPIEYDLSPTTADNLSCGIDFLF